MVAEHGWRSRAQISERIDEHIVDPLEAKRADLAEIEKSLASRDRILQGTVEQISDVPVPQMVEQLVKLPKTVSQDRIQQRTAEQIVDIPVPQVVEELVEVSRVFRQDRIQQRFVEQTDETPDISLKRSLRGLSLRHNRP